MKKVSFETTVKEILKNQKLKDVFNSVSGNMFANPALAQAETLTLAKLAALFGANGTEVISGIIQRANEILETFPDEEDVDVVAMEIQNSKGLEAEQSEEDRLSHIKTRTSIKPGEVWYDTEGNRIQAHGASIYYENGTYYWIGENKDHTTKEGEIWTWGVKIYSSKDLYNWTDEGYLVEPELNDKTSPLYPVRRLDRPHIIYNAATEKYVLWLKFCDGAHFAVLTSDSLTGKYTIVNAHYRPYDTDCGDFDLVKDEKTGKAYLYWEVNHSDVWGAELLADYTQTQGEPVKIYKDVQTPFTREAVCHMQRGGKHYIITSGMTGYLPNPAEVAVSDDWLNGYVVQGNPHVDDKSSASFNSQISHIFKVEGKDRYIAVADRWVPEFQMTAEIYDIIVRVITSRYDKTVTATDEERALFASFPMLGTANTSIANYVWLPIEFDGDVVQIKWLDEWTV